MNKTKEFIRKHIKWTYLYQDRRAKKYYSDSGNHFDFLLEDERPERKRFVQNRNNKTEQIVKMLEEISIKLRPDNRFQTWIDTGLYVGHFNSMTDNVPPYYSLVLDNSIQSLKKLYEGKKGLFYYNQYRLLEGVEKYIIRIEDVIVDYIDSNNGDCSNLKKTKSYFERMLTSKAETLEEALQRILFWSSLFWQSQHVLVGLGRLDKILDRFVTKDDDYVDVLCDFFKEVHRYYAFKSGPVSLGDTGQLVIVGGKEEDGSYFCNKLTYDIIRAMKACNLPDPKVLLRVEKNTPDDLLEDAVECIKTGIGCPLLANDDAIIPSLIDFGYEESDAYDYVTSACWEPLAYGKSLEKNNLRIINFAAPLTEAVSLAHDDPDSFDTFVECYLDRLRAHINGLLHELDSIKWEADPLGSLFTEDCFRKGQDLSEGGAKYNDYGILSVGLSNTINSLMNIKSLVYDDRRYSLTELKKAVENNYEGSKELENELKAAGYFGTDSDFVVALTRRIVEVAAGICETYRNPLGGRVKFGLSSSNYVEAAHDTSATFDGRKNNEPLRAHITSSSGTSYTELVSFASKLNYSGVRANGNVVDFFVAPSMLEDNLDKFVMFLKGAIRMGFFEMQMNVVSSKQLVDAKQNPEKYPNLIVRVWGYSAYFKDLPEEYQNVLIERALQSEGIVS